MIIVRKSFHSLVYVRHQKNIMGSACIKKQEDVGISKEEGSDERNIFVMSTV